MTDEGPRELSHRWPALGPLAAYGSLAVPFVIILIRLAGATDRGIFLPDDLALVDLHTRLALHWQQSLGPFDRFGWNHPGPSYFYLLAIAYRLLGSGPAAAFFGAALLNGLAALAVVAVSRRFGGPVLALWAAVCVGALEIVLSINSPAALTYSEGALGAGVSPWTATVIVVPLLLFCVLCAAAVTPSPLALLGALLIGSFVVQTDFSASPLVVLLFLLAAVGAIAATVADRRRPQPVVSPSPQESAAARRRAPRRWPWSPLVLTGLGTALLAAMWIPPLIQNVTTHPGNLDLIYRFFTAPHPVHPLSQGLKALVAVDAVAFLGPAEIMSTVLGNAPGHGVVAVIAVVVFVSAGAAACVVGFGRRNRFALALGGFSLLGLAVMIFAVARITGLIFGYLVLWEITLPTIAVLGLGAALLSAEGGSHLGSRRGRHRSVGPTPGAAPRWLVPTLVVLAVVSGLGLCVRMVALPSLSAVSDPHVGAVVALVTPKLPSTGPVFVGDEGLALIDTEEFIGVVNQLDRLGYHPKVNSFWLTEFGPLYVADADHIGDQVGLVPWSVTAPRLPGYVGRVGDIAVTVTTARPSPR